MDPSSATALQNISLAKQALAEARDFSDIVQIRDAAVAAHAWAVARGADEAAQMAMDLKLRAERKAGGFLAEFKSNGIIKQGRPRENGSTLELFKIDKKESHRWQRIWAIPEDRFEEYINNAKDRTQRTLLKIAKEIQDEQNQNHAELNVDDSIYRENATLIQGDFRVICKQFPENSIDYIITDPPYGKEYLDLYEDLAKEASRLLKQGGSLLILTGQSYLPEILPLISKHVSYNWIAAYLTPGGQSAQLWQRKVNTFWKPLLWFVKGVYEGKWVGDVTRSAVNDNQKDHMDWQQSESGMSDIVERFTENGTIIMDPFMGSGTTGVAALKLSRKFIGIELDQDLVNLAQRRIAEAT